MAFSLEHLPPAVREAWKHGAIAWMLVVQEAMKAGIDDADDLASMVFYLHHPERVGRPIESGETDLIAQWNGFRALIVPMIKHAPRPEKKGRTEPVTIYALQRERYADDTPVWFHSLAKEWGDGERWVEIATINDFVQLIKDRCGERGYVRRLRIGGHGSKSSFRLGTVRVSSLNIAGIAPLFSDVLPYFRPGHSLIQLDNCLVGHDQALLRQVSRAFGGVAVMGPFELQGPEEGEPVFEGGCVICGPNACVRLPSPNMRTADLLEIIHLYVDPVYEIPWK